MGVDEKLRLAVCYRIMDEQKKGDSQESCRIHRRLFSLMEICFWVALNAAADS